MELKEEKIEISVNQEDVQNIIDCYEKDIKYIKKLENNWNELREYILEDNWSSVNGEITSKLILRKMQEIEGGGNDDSSRIETTIKKMQ